METKQESITKLEWRVDSHDVEIALLKQTSSELKTALEVITMTLKQIKWIAIGGAAVYCADQIGIMGILKLAAL